jgi:nitrate/nitrite transporter NarK
LAALLTWVTDLPSLYGLFVVLGLMMGMAVATVVVGLVHLSWWFPNRMQGSVAGAFLFSFSLGPGMFGAFAFAAIDTLSIGGFFLLWSLLVYGAAVAALFISDPPYTQLLRLMKKKGLLVETLPGESSRSLVDLSRSNVSQSQLIAVCRDAIGQEVFPENAFLRDLRLSLTRLENWCIIGLASITLGCLLSFTVWIPTFYLGVFQVESNISGYILMVSNTTGFFLLISPCNLTKLLGKELCRLGGVSEWGSFDRQVQYVDNVRCFRDCYDV